MKKILISIMAISIILLLTGCGLWNKVEEDYNNRIDAAVNSTVKVPVANTTINPGQIITSEMVDIKDVPRNEIKDEITSIHQVVGKYTSNTCTVSKGGFFYNSCLAD